MPERTEKAAENRAGAAGGVGGPGRRERLLRLYALGLFLVVGVVAGNHFLEIAQSSAYDIHSDDVLWIERFREAPLPASVERDLELREEIIPPRGARPREIRSYWHGIDHPSLERWIYFSLLGLTGRGAGEELPEESWDYSKSQEWNVRLGHVAPEQARRFVRRVNAIFMVAAALLVYVGVARAATPAAGLVAGVFFTAHGATVEVCWSLGPDPLLWMLLAAALAAWVYLGATRKGAIAVGVLTGLAASAKLNGAFAVVAFCGWLLLKREWRLALLSGALAFGLFLVLNPLIWSKGLLAPPRVLFDMLRWRARRAALYAEHWPAFSEAPRWKVIFFLLGNWWPFAALLFVSRRLRRLGPACFWAAGLAALHLLTVRAPVPRYLFPIQATVGIGAVAAFWPRSFPGIRRALESAWRRLWNITGRGG